MDSYGHETERGEGSGQKEKEIEKSPQKIPFTKSQKAHFKPAQDTTQVFPAHIIQTTTAPSYIFDYLHK